MKKTIYSLAPLRELLLAANRRRSPSRSRRMIAGIAASTSSTRMTRNSSTHWAAVSSTSGLPKQGSARAVEGPNQRPDLTAHETPSSSRPNQKGRPHLQVLPHRTRQTGHRSRSQAQGALHYPCALARSFSLNANSCQNRQGSDAIGTIRSASQSQCREGRYGLRKPNRRRHTFSTSQIAIYPQRAFPELCLPSPGAALARAIA